MALVDTQGFVMAVDRSLFGPQGRRWIERRLPNVATNLSFIAVSAFGACILAFHITREYYESGYWAILQTPKHILNTVVLHLVVRALRWHIDRMLGVNFAAGDEALPDFFGASVREEEDDGQGSKDQNRNNNNGNNNNNRKAAVLWPWQSSHNQASTSREARDRQDSVESTTDQEQHGWWGGSGGSHDRSGGSHDRNAPSNKNRHRRAFSADMTSKEAHVSAIQEESVSGSTDNGSGADIRADAKASSSLGTSAAARSRRKARDRRRFRNGSRASARDKKGEAEGEDEEKEKEKGNGVSGEESDHHGRQHHAFPDLFGACRHGHNSNNDHNDRRHHHRGSGRDGSSSSLPGSPTATTMRDSSKPSPRSSSIGRDGDWRGDNDSLRSHRRSSLEHTRTAAHRWIHVEGDGGLAEGRAPDGGTKEGTGGAVRKGGWTSDDGGAGGHGAGSRGSRRRLKRLAGFPSLSPSVPPPTAASTSGTSGVATALVTESVGPQSMKEHEEEKHGEETKQAGGEGEGEAEEGGVRSAVATAVVSAAAAAAAGIRGGSGDGDGGGSRRWRTINKLSRALGSSRTRGSRHGGAGGEKGANSEHQTLNFFTEDDYDELLHSTFFIKMCDDVSWLYVEDKPYTPELNWLLTLWGGYKITPRFQGEVKQNEAHRMLFQCESGRQKGTVRIRSRATNTFLFFLGIKQPLTWVAWDRDVVGGDWEDLTLEWVGKPQGPDGVLVGDERGRVVIRSRRINGYVSWNGSRFTHVPGREGATVFMLQRMAPSSSSAAASSSRRSRQSKKDVDSSGRDDVRSSTSTKGGGRGGGDDCSPSVEVH